ncbi:unnamed protein product [Aphis gossypii]|uniref:Uncharacterized protein n=1 Tax=Aphis gossypii TaxID=80765 RepID=A0A9P0J1K8_APHGO|nr:unnamed protein product [Aphis gossypii]
MRFTFYISYIIRYTFDVGFPLVHAFRVRRITDDSMSPRRDLIYTPYIQRLRLICRSFARVPPQPSPPPKRLSCPLVILYLERGFQNASDPAATTAGPTNAASATGCIEKRCIPREGQIPLSYMLYRILIVAPTPLCQSQMSRQIGKKSDIRCEHTTLYDDIIILLTYNIITTPNDAIIVSILL